MECTVAAGESWVVWGARGARSDEDTVKKPATRPSQASRQATY